MRQIAETLVLGHSNEHHEGHWKKKKKEEFSKGIWTTPRVTYTYNRESNNTAVLMNSFTTQATL